MTEEEPAPTRPPEPEFRDEPAGLQPHDLVAASIGSAAGAAVSSRFGIAGTLIGAALAPVFVMIAVAALGPQLRRGLRHPLELARRVRVLTHRQLGLALAAATLAFLGGLIALTVVESLIGKPIASVGRKGPDSGTTLAPKHEPEGLRAPANTTPEAEPGEPEGGPAGGKRAPDGETRTVTVPKVRTVTVPPAPTTPTQPPPTTPTTPAPQSP